MPLRKSSEHGSPLTDLRQFAQSEAQNILSGLIGVFIKLPNQRTRTLQRAEAMQDPALDQVLRSGLALNMERDPTKRRGSVQIGREHRTKYAKACTSDRS